MFLSLYNLPLCSFCTCEFPWMCLSGLVWLGHQSLLSSAVQRSLGHRTGRYLHPQEKYPRLLKLWRSKKEKKNVRPSLTSRTAEREAVPTFSTTLNLKKDQLLTIFTLLDQKGLNPLWNFELPLILIPPSNALQTRLWTNLAFRVFGYL